MSRGWVVAWTVVLTGACAQTRDGGASAWMGLDPVGASAGDDDDDATDSATSDGNRDDDAPAGDDDDDGPPSTTGSNPADDDGSVDAGDTGPEPATGDGQTEPTGPASTVCDGVGGQPLIPPTVCDGPNGNTTTEIPANDLYATSWFGCYMQDDGSIYMDPYDNCEFACGNQGLCPAGQDGPTCEANLRWFAADADRYGCGGRIRVTNCENGKSVILVTLDRGPNCNTVEKACDAPVLDMSHDAMVYLFDGGIYGGCEQQAVVVETVTEDTPLGPVD